MRHRLLCRGRWIGFFGQRLVSGVARLLSWKKTSCPRDLRVNQSSFWGDDMLLMVEWII